METIKNKQLLPILEGIKKISSLKLGGVRTKIILKNQKSLFTAFEELEEVKKKLVEQYGTIGEDGKVTFTEENNKLIEKEWVDVNEQDSGVTLLKLNSAELDQFSDLTLEQYEVLDLMSE